MTAGLASPFVGEKLNRGASEAHEGNSGDGADRGGKRHMPTFSSKNANYTVISFAILALFIIFGVTFQ